MKCENFDSGFAFYNTLSLPHPEGARSRRSHSDLLGELRRPDTAFQVFQATLENAQKVEVGMSAVVRTAKELIGCIASQRHKSEPQSQAL